MQWILDCVARLARRMLHGFRIATLGLILAGPVRGPGAATAWAVWAGAPDVDDAVAVPAAAADQPGLLRGSSCRRTSRP